MKICTVCFATPERQLLWRVTVADDATVAQVLDKARELAGSAPVSWDAEVGIFGELTTRNSVPQDGDRVELYRPLKSDPKVSRRAREKARKAARDREA
jgi:putative ubiquitin-RnfH superfamily antitoxin RatB of RatAB toxin-antitoxin module